MAKKLSKISTRKNFLFPTELVRWAEKYTQSHNTTMTRLIVDYFTKLRQQVENGDVEQV